MADDLEPIFNVRVSVVEFLPAANDAEAIGRLTKALNKAGFDVYDGDEPHAFESEPLDPAVERFARGVWRGGWMRSPRELSEEGIAWG